MILLLPLRTRAWRCDLSPCQYQRFSTIRDLFPVQYSGCVVHPANDAVRCELCVRGAGGQIEVSLTWHILPSLGCG